MVPSVMHNEIIKNVHEIGHFAMKRTEDNIKQEYFISNLYAKVEKCIATE